MTEPVKIASRQLTTCTVLREGEVVTLGLVDEAGIEVALHLPFDQAQAVAMTLPTLLNEALKSLTGSTTARYAFRLERWSVEQVEGTDDLIMTLATADGFQVTFSLPAAACEGLGLTLATNAARCAEAEPGGTAARRSRAVLN
jgi:hypothetical protein